MTSIDPHTLTGDWHYPTAIRFGPGRIRELAQACREAGITRPLLVDHRREREVALARYRAVRCGRRRV